MANPPIAPYCTTSAVAIMVPKVVGGEGDFLTQGKYSKDTVEQWVLNIASRINGALAAAGYILPLAAMDGETWPQYQTDFMEYFNAVGVASLFSDDPTAPTYTNITAGVKKGRSRYQRDWDVLIDGLEENVAKDRLPSPSLIRAAARSGSNAEYLLDLAAPPMTDGIYGYPHPSIGDRLRDWTKRKLIYMKQMQEGHEPGADPLSIDYMRNLRTNTGINFTRGN